jgi:hypothetical protein
MLFVLPPRFSLLRHRIDEIASLEGKYLQAQKKAQSLLSTRLVCALKREQDRLMRRKAIRGIQPDRGRRKTYKN